METETSLIDRYGRYSIDSDRAIEILLEGRDIEHAIFVDSVDVRLYNANVEQVLEKVGLSILQPLDVSEEEFHREQQKKWLMPQEYYLIDVLELLLSLCNTELERERVLMEYQMYKERDMIQLLQYMVYFRVYCTKNKHIIGVGRGSSVASYCLYLLGIHKVDSLKYKLDIGEFLK